MLHHFNMHTVLPSEVPGNSSFFSVCVSFMPSDIFYIHRIILCLSFVSGLLELNNIFRVYPADIKITALTLKVIRDSLV